MQADLPRTFEPITPVLKLGDQTIHGVRSTKCIGIHIDDQLQWVIILIYLKLTFTK